MDRGRERSARNRGLTLIYGIVAMTTLMMFVSLAVDLGHVQLVKTELRCAADAAARAAGAAMAGGVSAAEAAAIHAGSCNTADGASVSISSATDIEFGTWDNSGRNFTVLSGVSRNTANAIRITTRRTAARGNPVNLMFARVLGRTQCDVTASAIVLSTPSSAGAGAGVGLSSITIKGYGSVDSYNSNSGTYSAGSSASLAVLQTNGNITVKDHGDVNGEAHPGASGSITIKNSGSVSGATAPLGSTLSYANATPGEAASSNSNGSLPGNFYSSGGGGGCGDGDDDHERRSGHHDDDDDDDDDDDHHDSHCGGDDDGDDDDDGEHGSSSTGDFEMEDSDSYTMSAGTYYFENFELKDSARLSTSGAVTIYITGDLLIEDSARITASANKPSNVTFKVIGNGTVTIRDNAQLAASIYAPESDFSLEDDAVFYGGVIGRKLTIRDNADFHYDTALGSGSGGSTVTLSVVQ